MPTYKVIYFDSKGRGETIRLALTVAGQDFEDVRYVKEEWEKVKPTFPQKQLPCLQVDGRYIPQSGAIMRYVGRAFGLYGANNDESTGIDVILGATDDFVKHVITATYEKDDAKKAELKKDIEQSKVVQYMDILEEILKENNGGDGFFVGDKISVADILVFDMLDQVTAMITLPAFPPKLGALIDRVKTYPKIKEYLAKRK
ncbi:glutathione S-transferase 1-like [Ostrea edulis]|uniref:glutathione S-transferase 1-like n=1 Tax=Ostrea edulis TaxID=37623 RepID=UPI002094F76B|nr:glutathione S-transferase 1-like [Ostrea edulis]